MKERRTTQEAEKAAATSSAEATAANGRKR
jgi:hypothetical protein